MFQHPQAAPSTKAEEGRLSLERAQQEDVHPSPRLKQVSVPTEAGPCPIIPPVLPINVTNQWLLVQATKTQREKPLNILAENLFGEGTVQEFEALYQETEIQPKNFQTKAGFKLLERMWNET